MTEAVSEFDTFRKFKCPCGADFAGYFGIKHRHFNILFDRQIRKKVE